MDAISFSYCLWMMLSSIRRVCSGCCTDDTTHVSKLQTLFLHAVLLLEKHKSTSDITLMILVWYEFWSGVNFPVTATVSLIGLSFSLTMFS